jgi:hypothetical protein
MDCCVLPVLGPRRLQQLKATEIDAYALAAFKAGLLAILAQYKPEGDASVRPGVWGVFGFGELNDPPGVVGRMMPSGFGTQCATRRLSTISKSNDGCKMLE